MDWRIICQIFFVILILSMTAFDLFQPMVRRYLAFKKGKKYRKKFGGEVIGTVIGNGKRKQYDIFLFLCSGRSAYRHSAYNAFSPIVKYSVDDCEYEIDAEDYTTHMPVLGRRARVIYNPADPAQACVYLPRKYGKRLKVDRRDEQYIYCSKGMKKDIAIPLELTEERAVPGRFVVEKYGFCHLEQPEDRKKSMMESIEDASPFKIQE